MKMLRFSKNNIIAAVIGIVALGVSALVWWLTQAPAVAPTADSTHTGRFCATLDKAYKPDLRAPNMLRFAIIGDYGQNTAEAQAVAQLVATWSPSFVLTVGDNNDPDGAAETIDANVGRYYSAFIGNYSGAYGAGAGDVNRFFPTMGNHDWDSVSGQPYWDYFTLPHNERYYDFGGGGLQFFALSSDPREPHGIKLDDKQADWLRTRLSETDGTTINIVYFHHPPYSSAKHGSTVAMQWPFYSWGADVVISGHDHVYERLAVDKLPYIVNGLGGAPSHGFGPPLAQSQAQYNCGYGAMLGEWDGEVLTLRFITTDNTLVDVLVLTAG
jgi:tartrate-resistant acid phosphatase type 5